MVTTLPSAPSRLEEEPLSAWIHNNRHGTASRSKVTLNRAKRSKGERWPEPRNPDDPITVELVRGAYGPDDDQWTVVVDGLTCEERPDTSAPTCMLPPPCTDAAPLTAESRARPLSISVRLESEALAPEQVQVVLEQAVLSHERNDGSYAAVEEVIEVQRTILVPYDTRQPSANAISFPYLIRVPAQSTLGIVSYQEIAKWKDRVAQITEYNRKRKEAYMKKIGNMNKIDASLVTEPKTKLNPEKPRDPERSHVLGGGSLSAVAAATEAMKVLTETCILARNTVKDKNSPLSIASMKNHIQLMRAVLAEQGKDAELAMLETLISGTPSPTRNMKRKNYVLKDGVWEKNTDPTPPETGTVDELPIQWEKTTQFLYERIELVKRKETTTRLRIRIEIREPGGDAVRSILFEAPPQFGIVAHCIYSRVHAELDEFLKAGRQFVNCMLGMSDEITSLGFISDRLNHFARLVEGWWEPVSTAQRVWKMLPFTSKRQNFDFKTDHLEVMVVEMGDVFQHVLPEWPSPEGPDIMDAMAEMEASEYKDLNDIESGGDQSSADIRLHIEWIKAEENKKENKGLVDELKKYRGELEAKLEAKLKEESEEDASTKKDDDFNQKFEVRELRELSAYQLESVWRELPQIVKSAQPLKPRMVDPANTEAGDQPTRALPVEETWTSWIASLIAGSTAFFGYTSFGYSLLQSKAKAETALGIWTALSSFATISGLAATASLMATLVNMPLAVLGGGAFLYAMRFTMSAGKMQVTSIAKYSSDIVNNILGGVSTAFYAGSIIIQWSKNASQERSSRVSAYSLTLKKATGNPILSSLALGKATLKAVEELADEAQRRIGTADLVGQRFAAHQTHRFRLSERFELPTEPLNLNSIFTDDDWAASPFPAALLLLPPTPIAEVLYEAEELRRLPLSTFVRNVAGDPGTPPSSPAEIAAQSALNEILSTIAYDRYLLRGEHMVNSAEGTARSLAVQAAAAIQAAYGPDAGVTRIRGDDILWTCLPSAKVARLVLRHLPLFGSAEESLKMAKTPDENYSKAVQVWRPASRQMVSNFTKALVAQAKVTSFASEDVRRRSVEAERSFARVSALTDRADALYAVCASYSLMFEGHSDAIAVAASERPHARQFADQRSALRPAGKVVSLKERNAFWASRRMDPEPAQKWPVGRSDEKRRSLTDLTDELAALSVNDAGIRHYYCPLGSRIGFLPGASPFAVQEHGSRLVWLEPLQRAFAKLKLAEDSDGLLVSAKVATSFTSDRIGLARHPLVVVASEEAIAVTVAPSVAGVQNSFPLPKDAVQAATTRNALIGTAVSILGARVRAAAFNADRLLNAIMLAAALPATDVPSLRFELPDHDAATSLALAMAIAEVDLGGMPFMVGIVNGKGAQQRMENSEAACARALQRGCKVASLAEVCAALA